MASSKKRPSAAADRGWIQQHPRYPLAHETHSFDPEGMKIVFQDMLDESGVRTFGYLVAGEPIVEAGKLRGVLVDAKQGRRAILARIVIDATGDGDVAAKAGCPFDIGRPSDGGVQGMTMMYRVCNIDEAALKTLSPERFKAIRANGGRQPPRRTAALQLRLSLAPTPQSMHPEHVPRGRQSAPRRRIDAADGQGPQAGAGLF